MNNKGFTLIELLVTIALLGIIISISFISINSVIEKSKKRDCEKIIDSLKSTASEYVSDKRYDKEFISSISDSNRSIILTSNDLINKHYLSGNFVDPFTKQPIYPYIVVDLNDDYTIREATVNGISCDG